MTVRPPLRHIAVIFAPAILLPAAVSLIVAAPVAAQIIDATNKVHPDELRKRAGKGDIEAMWMLQKDVVRYKNPKKKKEPEKRFSITKEERLNWIRAGAEAGDPYSQERFALILGKGISSGGGYDYDDFSALVPIEYTKSARIARLAATGFPSAQGRVPL